MSALRNETIKIRFGDDTEYKLVKVEASCSDDFAVHPILGGAWSITHRPTGLSLKNVDCTFDHEKDAVAAMAEIQALHDGWSTFTVTDRDKKRELAESVAEIGRKHGGWSEYAGPKWAPVLLILSRVSPHDHRRLLPPRHSHWRIWSDVHHLHALCNQASEAIDGRLGLPQHADHGHRFRNMRQGDAAVSDYTRPVISITTKASPWWPALAGFGMGIIVSFVLLINAASEVEKDRIKNGYFDRGGKMYRIVEVQP